MKKILLLATLMCSTLGLASCGSNGGGDVNDKMKWLTDPKMTTEYQEMLGWTTTITGLAQNISGKQLSYVQCSFALYDKDNVNLGSAWANVNDLAPNDKWNVEASYLGWTTKEPVKFVFNGFSQF